MHDSSINNNNNYNDMLGLNPQARCMSTTVAGESNWNPSVGNPDSFLASFTASRIAKNTLLANTKGGSPVALED